MASSSMVSKDEVLSAKHYTTPYNLDQAFRQVVKYETMQRKEFWRVQPPHIRDQLGMDWTQTVARVCPPCVPQHAKVVLDQCSESKGKGGHGRENADGLEAVYTHRTNRLDTMNCLQCESPDC